jgi:hypothetical protein
MAAQTVSSAKCQSQNSFAQHRLSTSTIRAKMSEQDQVSVLQPKAEGYWWTFHSAMNHADTLINFEMHQLARRRYQEDILAEEIFQPATAFKLAIAHRRISGQSIDSILLGVFDKLQEVPGCYLEYCSFDNDNRYYDVNAHLDQHINAFYRIAGFC